MSKILGEVGVSGQNTQQDENSVYENAMKRFRDGLAHQDDMSIKDRMKFVESAFTARIAGAKIFSKTNQQVDVPELSESGWCVVKFNPASLAVAKENDVFGASRKLDDLQVSSVKEIKPVNRFQMAVEKLGSNLQQSVETSASDDFAK